MNLLIRKNRGRRILRPWLDSLSIALGHKCAEEDLLSLEVTDEFRARFMQAVRCSRLQHRLVWPSSERRAVFTYLLRLAGMIAPEAKVVLLSSVDDIIGGVLVPGRLALQNAELVWKAVEYDLNFANSDLTTGLCLGLSIQGRQSEYDLTAWGTFREENVSG